MVIYVSPVLGAVGQAGIQPGLELLEILQLQPLPYFSSSWLACTAQPADLIYFWYARDQTPGVDHGNKKQN